VGESSKKGTLRTERCPLEKLPDALDCRTESGPELKVRSRGWSRDSERLVDRLAGADLAAATPAFAGSMRQATVSPWDFLPMLLS